MRFAWLRQQSGDNEAIKQGCTHPLVLIRLTYNAVFWIFLLPFFTAMAYETGFVLFTIVIVVRLTVNLYTNNMLNLTPAQFDGFPLRSP